MMLEFLKSFESGILSKIQNNPGTVSPRNKFGLEERLEKLLVVVAIFHFLAMMVGGEARRRGYDRGFRANTVTIKPTHSDFTLGQYYLMRIRWSLLKLFQNFYAERVPLFVG